MNKNLEKRRDERGRRLDRRRNRLNLERLEDRTLLAYTFSISGSVGTATSNGVSGAVRMDCAQSVGVS